MSEFVRTFLQFGALFLTIASALFLVRSVASLSAPEIAELSATKFDSNPDVARGLAAQRGDARVGTAMLLAAVAMQMGDLIWPKTWDSPISGIGVAAALAFTVGAWVAGRFASRSVEGRTLRAVEAHRARSEQE